MDDIGLFLFPVVVRDVDFDFDSVAIAAAVVVVGVPYKSEEGTIKALSFTR
jgi:hypothetical protein